MRVAGSQQGDARSNWQAALRTARVVGAKPGVIEGEGGGGWAEPNAVATIAGYRCGR